MILKSIFRLLFPEKCPHCRSEDIRAVAGNFDGDTLYYCQKCQQSFAIKEKA